MKQQPYPALAARLAMALASANGLFSTAARADAMQDCLAKAVGSAADDVTIRDLREACLKETGAQAVIVEKQPESLAHIRVEKEARSELHPHSLTAYKQNYFLPYSYAATENPNYVAAGLHYEHEESKFQFSFRFPLTQNDLFVQGDGLDFGYTQQSFWQTYNTQQSEPFRESDYNPEIFYTMPLTVRFRGGYSDLRFGAEHQSNGLGVTNGVNLSRSWNRLYAKLIYSKDNYVIAVRPWYRIPESKNTSPTDTTGDDNPDIEKYMGYFDLTGALSYRKFEFSLLARNNLRTTNNYGAIELGMSFPLYHRLRGYAQFFNGYGDSLIDYNQNITRYGIGILFTDML